MRIQESTYEYKRSQDEKGVHTVDTRGQMTDTGIKAMDTSE
jgi:hypothetical protein